MLELIKALIIGCLLISTATVAAASCADYYCYTCPDVNSCDVCQPGFFVNVQNGCERCSSGCASCTTFVLCEQCRKRFYLTSKSYCSKCPIFCSACNNYTSCSACDTGHYGTQCLHNCQEHCVGGACGNDRCTHGCNEGFYMDSDHVCRRCQTVCKSCSSRDTCNSCYTGRYGSTCSISCKSTCTDGTCDISTGRCGIACPNGQYLDPTGHCSACTSPCEACVNINTTCTRCESGYFLDGKICRKCSVGCASCISLTHCSTCTQGYYMDHSDQCHQCLAACSTCTSKTRCTSCKLGYYLSTGQCYPCSLECKDQQCESDGNCTNGCASPERFGTKCDELCADELLNCSVCTTTANVVKCALCKTGFHLESDNCVPNITCSSQCKDGLCDQDGNCTNGCSSRDRYGPTCDKRCSAAVQFCSECNTNGGPVICIACQTGYNLHSGSCHLCPSNCNQGCVSDDDGITCKKDAHTAPDRTTTTEGTNTTIWIVIAVAGVIIAILSVVVVIACVGIRKLQAVFFGNQKTDVQLEATGGHHQTGTQHPRPETSNNPYMDLSPDLRRDAPLYDTAHTVGPHPRTGTRENVGHSNDDYQYINLIVE